MSEAGFELGFSDAGARILSAFLCLMGNDGNSLSRGFLWARYGLPSLLNQAGPPRPPSASWSASCTAPVGEACGLGEYIQVGGMLVSFLLLTCAMFSNQLYQYLRICFSCIWSAWPLCLDLNLSVVFNIIGSQRKAKYLTSIPGLRYCTHSKLPLILALTSQVGELLSFPWYPQLHLTLRIWAI